MSNLENQQQLANQLAGQLADIDLELANMILTSFRDKIQAKPEDDGHVMVMNLFLAKVISMFDAGYSRGAIIEYISADPPNQAKEEEHFEPNDSGSKSIPGSFPGETLGSASNE